MSKLIMVSCQSVPGGWRTCINDSMLIGPIFNDMKELWNWQRINIEVKK
jgi:hypothetical protein